MCSSRRPNSTPFFQQAFTLIELIAVIVILAVVAVTAVPRFFDSRDDAINAQLKTIAASMRAGVDNARLAWRVRGGGTGAVSDMSGWGDGTADFSNRGWIMGTSGSTTTLSATQCLEIFRAVLSSAPKIVEFASALPNTHSAAYQAGLGCVYRIHTASGTAMYNAANNNTIFVVYDPLRDWALSPNYGHVASFDRSSITTHFAAPN